LRRLSLASLSAFALAQAGCSFRPWTPSVAVAYWSEDVPTYRDATIPRASVIAAEWQLPFDNPWSKYQKQTLIASLDGMPQRTKLPDINELGVIGDAIRAGDRVGRAGIPNDTMFVVDLRGAASCAFGASVSKASASPVSNVVTFNNWPADSGLIPAEETLSGMIAFQPKPAVVSTSAHPIFLLDSWRLAYRFDEPDEETYDNRYVLGTGDLPDPETLRAAGISRVVYVVEDLDDAEYEEDDLHAAFGAYRDAGIAMFMVDLDWLATQPVPDRWPVLLESERLVVVNRVTILDSPVFYARAHSGFGGAHGRPSVWSGGGGGGFGGGGHGHGGYGG
jgi:hypothetical protein